MQQFFARGISLIFLVPLCSAALTAWKAVHDHKHRFNLMSADAQQTDPPLFVLEGDHASALKKGSHGVLYAVSLRKTIRPTVRKCEDPTQFERIVQVHAPTSSALALYRFKIWWMRPSWGSSIPPETILLLDQPIETDGIYRLLLAVVLPSMEDDSSCTGFASASLSRSLSSPGLVLCSSRPQTGLYIGTGRDPYALIQDGAELANSLWCRHDSDDDDGDSSNCMSRRSTDSVLRHKLGWCTWNAFYTDVTGENILNAVEILQNRHGIPLRWMILDDGWQDTTTQVDEAKDGDQWSHRLKSWKEHPTKFRDLSLADAIRKLKDANRMEKILVWHTLSGYWLGLNPAPDFDSELEYPKFPRGIVDNDRSAPDESSVSRGIRVPRDPRAFFRGYHNYLRTCGVDGVKVDAQGVFGTLHRQSASGEVTPTSTVLSLHESLAKSIVENLDEETGVVHCMAHAPEIFFRLPSLYSGNRSCHYLRTADDFYPENAASHACQLVACAYNSILFRHVASLDWDMFTTSMVGDPRYVRMHAVARCLSGGPIYLSDSPDSQPNASIIEWLCCLDGTTLPCQGAAVPARSCLLQDPLKGCKPLVICNTNGRPPAITSGALGIFNLAKGGRWDASVLDYVPITSEHGGHVRAIVRPADIDGISGERFDDCRFLAVSFFSENVTILESSQSTLQVSVEELESEAIAILPLNKAGYLEFAALGIEGRINGAGAVLGVSLKTERCVSMIASGCGNLIAAVKPPVSNKSMSVALDGQLVGCNVLNLISDDQPAREYHGTRGRLLELGFSVIELQMPSSKNDHTVQYNFS